MIPLLGKTVIQHIWELLNRVESAEKVLIATTTSVKDDPLVMHLERIGALFYRGNEEDVLSRFYHCAKSFGSELIIRITADDPLKDPQLIDRAVNEICNSPKLDYISNTIKPTFPAGLEVEVFWFKVLEKAYKEAKLSSEREHVTPYIWKNPSIFNIKNFEHSEDLNKWRWTLDKVEDLKLIELLYDRFYHNGKLADFRLIIQYLKEHPELVRINIETDRDEGYVRSVAKDLK